MLYGVFWKKYKDATDLQTAYKYFLSRRVVELSASDTDTEGTCQAG